MGTITPTSSFTTPTPWTIGTLRPHPRMLWTPARITRGQGLWASPPSNMVSLKNFWNTQTSGIAYALQYLMTGSSTALTNAYNAAIGEAFATEGTNVCIFGSTTAWVLDWCYNGLTTTQIGNLVANLNTWVGQWESTINTSFDLGDRFEQQGFQAYIWGVLAGQGETGFTDRSANLRNAVQHAWLWINEMAANGMEFDYPYQFSRKIPALFAWFIAYGNESSINTNMPSYGVYSGDYMQRLIMADGISEQAKSNDERGGSDGSLLGGQQHIPGYIATVLGDTGVIGDSFYRWLANNYANGSGSWVGPGLSFGSGSASWLPFIFWDPNASRTAPAGQLCQQFPIRGQTSFRGGWNLSTDVRSWYFSAHFSAHDETMAGHFDIWRGNDMLIDSGYSYAGAGSIWQRTPSNTAVGTYSFVRNTVLFTPGSASDPDRGGCQIQGGTTLGASTAFPWSWNFKTTATGEAFSAAIVSYQDNGDSPNSECCVVGDLSNAYTPGTQVTNYKRYYDYIRGADSTRGTFVIRDTFTAAAGVTRIRALFWARQAFIATNVVVVTGTTSAGVLTCDNKITIQRGSSQAVIQMVSPSPNPVRLVGGGPADGTTPDFTSYFNGANTFFGGGNFGGNTPELTAQLPRIAGIWRAEFETTPAGAGGQMVFIISVGAIGDSVPTYTLTDAQNMAPLAFPGAPPITPPKVDMPANNGGLGRVLFQLIGANMNTANDQVFSAIGDVTDYAINAIYVTNASTSLTTVQGGIWSSAGQTGNNLVASTQAYSALTTSTKLLNTTLASGATGNAQSTAPVLHLSTIQGSAATADFYLLGSDLTAGGAASTPPPALNPNGAQWIAPTSATMSSLETGHVITLTAWGGNEYGYAYTFSLSGAPAGVTIDVDTGAISVASVLSVGGRTFTVTATNRENSSISNSFQFTLNVLAGITFTSTIGAGAITTSQIAHRTYDPGSGTFGNPTSGDWSTVFTNIKNAIIADQNTCNAVWDESLRVSIPLQRGTVYKYTNDLGNQWPTGIQYLNVFDQGSGALPVIQNAINDGPGWTDVYNDGPLNIGNGGGGLGPGPGALSHPLNSGSPPDPVGLKGHCALIASVSAGATTVTLLSSGDASKIKAGRWHMVMGWCISLTSFPPNVQVVDYVKVTNVSGTTVTIDRPLKYDYSQTWWENSNENNFGAVRLVPIDTGGVGGYIPTDPRLFIRQNFKNIDIQKNPLGPGVDTTLIQIGIDFTLDGCTCPGGQFSQVKHFFLKNVTATTNSGWELDKIIETFTIDGGQTAPYSIGQGTGIQYLLFRNHHAGITSISPRQVRAIGTWFDGSADGTATVGGGAFGSPVTLTYDGPINWWDFGSAGACQFTHGLDPHWMPLGAGGQGQLTIGTDATWSGNQLQIPVTSLGGAVGGSQWEVWLAKTYPGAIVATSAAPPHTTNYGYVTTVSSPGDGSANWLNITWANGSKPLSGTLYLNRCRRLNFAATNTFNPGTIWGSPGFEKEIAPGNETGWNFPPGLPAPYNE